MLLNNPYIDDFWIVEIQNEKELGKIWKETLNAAFSKKNNGDFDEIIIPQIIDERKSLYTGSIRELTLKSYKQNFNVPLTPIVNLTNNEIENVNKFINKYEIKKFKNIVLFECEPQSKQYDITPLDAIQISKNIVSKFFDTCFIITSSKSFDSITPQIIDGSVLTLRENAELIKHCNLLLGCSSGISWLSRSSWCINYNINTVQFLKTKTLWFNSLLIDHIKFNFDTSSILELYNPNFKDIEKCIINIFSFGFSKSKLIFQKRTPKSSTYYHYLLKNFLCNRKYKFAARLFLSNFSNNFLNLSYWVNNFYLPIYCLIKSLYEQRRFFQKAFLK